MDSESRRELHIIKSRGMEHSHRIRELIMSKDGLKLVKMQRTDKVGKDSHSWRKIVVPSESGIFSETKTMESSVERWELRLYVAGMHSSTKTAITNIKRICEEHLEGKYTLEIIDLLEEPTLAEGDQILAVPTLVRRLPEPLRKLVGDLSNTERVLVGLDLRPRTS